MPRHPDHTADKPGALSNRTDQMVRDFSKKMRDTYVLLGKSLIPLMEDKPEDIATLMELGAVYEQLGCMREAAITYERLRQLNPARLPQEAFEFLERHRDLLGPETSETSGIPPHPNEGDRT